MHFQEAFFEIVFDTNRQVGVWTDLRASLEVTLHPQTLTTNPKPGTLNLRASLEVTLQPEPSPEP